MSATFAAPPSTPATIRATCPPVSSTSGSIAGVIWVAPSGIRFGGTVTVTGPATAASRCRGRRLEQRPHRHLQPLLPQPLHQPDRQQRVPAQGEEVILRPHPLHAEHLGEHAAQQISSATVAGSRPAPAPPA